MSARDKKIEKDIAIWKDVYSKFSDALVLAHIKDQKERPCNDAFWQEVHLTILNNIAIERKLI